MLDIMLYFNSCSEKMLMFFITGVIVGLFVLLTAYFLTKL
jgi:hypothetical protein